MSPNMYDGILFYTLGIFPISGDIQSPLPPYILWNPEAMEFALFFTVMHGWEHLLYPPHFAPSFLLLPFSFVAFTSFFDQHSLHSPHLHLSGDARLHCRALYNSLNFLDLILEFFLHFLFLFRVRILIS